MNSTSPVVQALRFAHPDLLWLLLLVPVVWALVLLAWRSRRRARQTWAGNLFDRLAPGAAGSRERLRLVLYLIGYACVVLAMARPLWGGEMVMMKRRGIDVLVALDASNSMLAEDMRPNRLAAAKRAIAELVQRMGGDRLGLITFAGDAYTICPLTLDHGTVLLLLESINPSSVSLPGTNLEEAIARARASFVHGEKKHKALVIVTDGESTVGEPEREAQKAADEGILVYTIGIGSPDGVPIPERDESGNVEGYKRDRSGHVVNSRLDETTLQRIAEITDGRYFRATPQALELGQVFDELQAIEKKELEGQLATSYEERYQWPLGLAVLLLGLEVVVPARARRKESA